MVACSKAILHWDKTRNIERMPGDRTFFQTYDEVQHRRHGHKHASIPSRRKALTYMKYLLLSSSLEKDGLNGFVVASILDEIKAVLSGIYNG